MQSVNELCEKGNSLSEVGMYQEALSCFKHALEITPETYDYEDERVWILVAIGDTLFQLQQYSNAMEYVRRAYFYDPGNPFINLRLGQCELESDCILDAKEHLLKAYMAEGSTIFEGENLKYLQAIKRLIRH